MTPLRILQVNSLFQGGGADNQTHELAARLREGGDAVRLSVPDGSRWEPRTRRLDVPARALCYYVGHPLANRSGQPANGEPVHQAIAQLATDHEHDLDWYHSSARTPNPI